MSRNYEDITNRVAQIQTKRAAAAKSASETPNAEDPNEQGTVTPPNHPDGDSAAKKNLPEGSANSEGKVGLPEGTTTNPSGHGENVPGDVSSGDAKDKQAQKPNDPISKIAGIVERVKGLQSGSNPKEASTEDGGNKPKEASTEDGGNKPKDKKAGEAPQELSYEVRCKLANEICATEEGMQMAESLIKKAYGREYAAELIQSAGDEYHSHVKAAAEYEQHQKQAAAEYGALEQAYGELTKNASEEDMNKVAKFGDIHSRVLDTLEHDFEKAAYLKAAMDAATMEDAMAGGAAPEEAMIPEGGEEPLSPEAILALLEELLAAGQIDEATAEAVAAEVLGGAEGGAPAAGGPEAGMPPEEEMPEEVKAANSILADIEKESENK